jgi:benzoylformate decarboxylase
VQITSDPSEAARAPMGTAIIASIRAALHALAVSVADADRPPLPDLAPHREPASHDGCVDPAELFSCLRTHAPRDTVYVTESTSTSAAFWAEMDLDQQGSYYFPASGGLGFGLPAAVGAQLARPDRPVIALIGDGSANYGITALWTAAQYRIPVVFVILKNGTYGALRWFTQVLDAGETPGLDVPGLDFVAISEGYGVPATAVSTAEDFITALQKGLANPGPTLIEVLTAPAGQ